MCVCVFGIQALYACVRECMFEEKLLPMQIVASHMSSVDTNRPSVDCGLIAASHMYMPIPETWIRMYARDKLHQPQHRRFQAGLTSSIFLKRASGKMCASIASSGRSSGSMVPSCSHGPPPYAHQQVWGEDGPVVWNPVLEFAWTAVVS